jgi:hypothetical protein
MGKIWRVVETQEKAATREITANRDEQERLEELLDQHKPSRMPGTGNLSYLLATPFRYPPLEYGSRFGGEQSPGIFYGALELQTALLETAVYLWLFQRGSRAATALSQIRDERMSFSVPVNTLLALDTSSADLTPLSAQLSAPADWSLSQAFGGRARQTGAEAIWYVSARRKEGTNVAVLSPAGLASKRESGRQHWQLRLTRDHCWFGLHNGESHEFSRTMLEEEGVLEHPAL